MSHEMNRKPRKTNKTLLAVKGIVATIMPGVLYAMSPQTTPAQPNIEHPRFEVASIKPGQSGDGRPLFDFKPELFRAMNVTVNRLIQVAYGVRDFQVAGGPEWIRGDLFEITAKPPVPSKSEQMNLMLQVLLADRFQLVVRHETKEMPVYALVVAKNGPKLGAVSASNSADPGGSATAEAGKARPSLIRIRRGLLIAQEAVMPMLAFQLSNVLGRTVLDKTGLTGKYDLKLEWAPDENQTALFEAAGIPENSGTSPHDALGPSLFSALQEQLGLRLEAQKGPVDTIVITRIQKPSLN